MADFPPDSRAALLAGLLCLALPAAAAQPRAEPRIAAPKEPACSHDIVVDSGPSQIDSRANRLTLADVTITQCSLSIRADKAVANGTGVSFDNSRWEFTGGVRIHFANGSLQADAATVLFAGNRIAQAQATGKPAEFEQQVENLARPVRGHAGSIDYDFVAQSVRLADEAFLFDGRNEMTSPSIVYSIKDQIARNEVAPGSRVRITIRPDGTPDAAVPTPTPPGSQK
jgi:lipopolysaccharide transport protein LptA